MEDIAQKEAEQVLTAEPVAEFETIPHTEDKPRRRKALRSIEELQNVPLSKMSEDELIKYAKHLQEDNAQKDGQLRTLSEAFQGVQQQKQKLETELQNLKLAARTQIQFCKDTVAQAYKTLHYMQGLEEF